MITYRQIEEIFHQLNHVIINAEGYCGKTKEYMLLINLFWQAMGIMHRVNDNDNKFAKYYTCSLLNTLQSKNVDLVEKYVNQILETIIW